MLTAVAPYSYIIKASRRSYRGVRLSPFIGGAGRLQDFVIVMRRSAWTRDEHCKVADIGGVRRSSVWVCASIQLLFTSAGASRISIASGRI